ncbi:MAG: transposase, partial [Cyanobacteria bacterium SBC]|nr:transposase [Cyanobacteria bacterium SBC]
AARNILAKGLRVLAEYLNSTQGHWGTGVKSPNAQGENDRWLADSDISHLSRLVELRTVELQESPTRARSV